MDCVTCKTPMTIIELNQVEVDYCLDCEGVWFDEGELEVLLGGAPAAKNFLHSFKPDTSLTKEPPKKCPICRKKMSKVSYHSKVLADECPQEHGLWFDKGELKAVFEDLDETGVSSHFKSVFGKSL